MEVLRTFATEWGIDYDLLSDEGSHVIRRLGLVNEHIEAQQAFYGRGVDERHVGLPYPGTFVLDEDGVVARRLFEQSYRPRPAAGYLMREASGVPPAPARSASSAQGPVEVTAWLDSSYFRPLELRELHVELRVAEPWHLYTAPVPEGFTALGVGVRADEAIATQPAQLPTGRPFTVQGLPEQFHVVDGSVQLAVPFQLPGAGLQLDGRPREHPGEPAPVELEAEVVYQACSDTECLPPTAQRLRLEVDEAANVPRG